MMRAHVKVLVATIMTVTVLGLAWWGASALGIGDKSLSETMTRRIQTAADDWLQKLTPGTTLHVQVALFNRHGPAASEIQTIPWSMPETTVGDMWLGPVDDDGIFAGYEAVVRDAAGNIVQEVTATGEEVLYRDGRLGEEKRMPWVPMSALGFLQAIADVSQRLLSDGCDWVASGSTWDGQETLVLEKLLPWDGPSTQEGAQGINIPYTLDLLPKEIVYRMEIVLDNPLLHREQTWVIDQQGDRILVKEEIWTRVELLDR